MGTRCCNWTARQNSPFFHPIGLKEVLSRQHSPRVSRLSVCGTGLHCWTKRKCSSDEEVQRYTFKPSKPPQNRKYFSGSVFWGITRTFSRAVEFGAYYRFASDLRSARQTLLESPLLIERERAHGRCFLPFALTGNRFLRSS